jgi:hypothetical protein
MMLKSAFEFLWAAKAPFKLAPKENFEVFVRYHYDDHSVAATKSSRSA